MGDNNNELGDDKWILREMPGIFSVGLYAVLDVAFQKETQIRVWN